MNKYNLYWTPCATHCINLMFEDIGKREGSVFNLITNARNITNFIHNHGWLLTTMRNVCGGYIVRQGATRFATNRYIGQIAQFCLFVCFCFFLHFFIGCIYNLFVSDISVIYRYIDDVSLILGNFFPIFHTIDFRLQKSCREGPSPEISTIYRQYIVTFSSVISVHFVHYIT